MLNKLRNAVKKITNEDYDLEQTIHEREFIIIKVLTDQKLKLAHITRIIKMIKLYASNGVIIRCITIPTAPIIIKYIQQIVVQKYA